MRRTLLLLAVLSVAAVSLWWPPPRTAAAASNPGQVTMSLKYTSTQTSKGNHNRMVTASGSFSGGNSFSRSWNVSGSDKTGDLGSSGSVQFNYTVSGAAPKDKTEASIADSALAAGMSRFRPSPRISSFWTARVSPVGSARPLQA